MLKLSLPTLFLLVLPLFFSGCAGPMGDGANAFDHYLTEEVSMIVLTNSEPGVPEKEPTEVTLPKGTRVRLIERGSAMSLIETMKGERGQVPAIDLEATDENQTGEPQAKMGKKILW